MNKEKIPFVSQYQKLQNSKITIPMTENAPLVSEAKFQSLVKEIKNSGISVISHYYVNEQLQRLAEETGGIVSDSLEMARFGQNCESKTIIVCGVRFMGETAKILNFNKQILMPNLEAQCSLDLSCPIDEFEKFCAQYEDRTIVVYANTSAQIKSIADWVVTSSTAVPVIQHLHQQNKKIIWAPDKYLGQYTQKQTGADMIIWDGACIVHESFKLEGLKKLQRMHPNCGLVSHPESPEEILKESDFIGSTSQLIEAVQRLPYEKFIVATDPGILYQMKKVCPDKTFFPTPTAGHSATCQSCNFCPWMAMNSIEQVEKCLREPKKHEIHVSRQTALNAQETIQKLLNFSKISNLPTAGDA